MPVTMSDKELSRINVIPSVVEKRMLRRDAARQLDLPELRPMNRLVNLALRDSPVFVVASPETTGFRNHLSCGFFHRCVMRASLKRESPALFWLMSKI